MEKKGEQYDMQANKGKKENIFKEGDLVWVHLRKERFLHLRKSKFLPRGDEPFQIVEKINDSAYKIDMAQEYGGSNSTQAPNLRLNSLQEGMMICIWKDKFWAFSFLTSCLWILGFNTRGDGPFKVVRRINDNAYAFDMPPRISGTQNPSGPTNSSTRNLKPKEDSRPRGPRRDPLGKSANSATSERESITYSTAVNRAGPTRTYTTRPTTRTKPKRTNVHTRCRADIEKGPK
ncbi:hypothetical protein CR513_21634, partial [Mucuna pruriens]